jgi:hypothetical protein
VNSYLRGSADEKIKNVSDLSSYILEILSIKDNIEFNSDTFYTFSTGNMKHKIFYYMTSFSIPVVINTKITLSIGKGLNYYFIVVPYEKNSLIMGIVPDGSPKYIQTKINSSFNNKLSIIEFVESIMSSCDGWYLRPSVINSMPENKKLFFEKDCMFINERKFYENYDFSIFDDLKVKVCNFNSDNELLHKIPTRDDYKERYDGMLKVIDRSMI